MNVEAKRPPVDEFEVATIRPAPADTGGDGSWSPPGAARFTAHHLTLAFLLHLAFNLDPKQIVSKMSWMESDLFDIDAKPEGGIPLTREQLRPLLQALLQERFHLRLHHETHSAPGYALVVAKGGPKLRPTAGDHFPGFRTQVDGENLQGFNWSMPYLASLLQTTTGRPVVDATGITGSYDINLTFAPANAADSTLPSLFTVLHDALGLDLKAREIPIDVLVVEQADRIPVED